MIMRMADLATTNVLKHAPWLCVLAICPALGQVPRAQPVQQAIAPDPANDFFLRGKNLHDSAKAAADYENRVALYQRAADILAAYLNEYPAHANAEMAWWYLGNSYYQSGNIDQANQCFRTLVNRYGKSKWSGAAAYTLAASAYNSRRYAEAAPMFGRYATSGASPSDRARGYYYQGNCYRLLGRDREAIEAYKRVLADQNGTTFFGEAKLGIAEISMKTKDYAAALPIFEDVLSHANSAKTKGSAALNAAICATHLDQPEKAETYLDFIMRTPGMEEVRPEAQAALMANYFKKKQYDEVVRIFQASNLQSKGRKEATRLMLAARSYMRLKRPTEALGLFREVEKLVKPTDEIAFQAAYSRLLCFFQIEGRHVPDQVDAFLQLYRKSRPKDPRIHTALMMKAESLEAEGKTEEAAKVYNDVDAGLISEKNRAGLYYKRGWLLAETGDNQGAIRSLTEFIDRNPGDSRVPIARAKRAKAYAATAESAKAIADFDMLTKPGVSTDLASFAWLESARLRRSESNVQDMILRYKGLLQCDRTLSRKLQAEANFFIGQGLVKSNQAKESVPHLETARKLEPDTYGKNAGMLLALGYFSQQDYERLSTEIITAIRGGYSGDIPAQAVQWAGMQAFNAGDYRNAAAFLAVISTPDEPRATAKEIWRYLAKARLETNNPEGALVAANNVLAVEDTPAWKADALLDRGRALHMLKRNNQARQATDEALAMQPQGRTMAGLRILSGDLDMDDGDPGKAAASYLIVVQFHEDKELRPQAIHKLVAAYRKAGDEAKAAEYEKVLKDSFPGWKPK